MRAGVHPSKLLAVQHPCTSGLVLDARITLSQAGQGADGYYLSIQDLTMLGFASAGFVELSRR